MSFAAEIKNECGQPVVQEMPVHHVWVQVECSVLDCNGAAPSTCSYYVGRSTYMGWAVIGTSGPYRGCIMAPRAFGAGPGGDIDAEWELTTNGGVPAPLDQIPLHSAKYVCPRHK